MKAIILAGGAGERLKPITNNLPKPMVEVNGRPILLHIINHFKSNGIKDFVIPLCYMPKVITDFFGNGEKFGIKIEYTYEDPIRPLGTAGAISLARDLIDDTFIVTYGDILRDLNIKKMIDFHRKNNSLATINVYKRKSLDAKSMVIIDKNKRVEKFIERPVRIEQKHIWVNGSFYIFELEIFSFITGERQDFGSNIFPELVQQKEIYAFPSEGYFVDIGNLEKLEYARRTFKSI